MKETITCIKNKITLFQEYDVDEKLGSFNLSSFINDLNIENSRFPNQTIIIEKLIKKIDVAKCLYIHYSLDLSSRCSDKKISFNSTNKLALILIYLCLCNKDYKILNTLLKLKDNASFEIEKDVGILIDQAKGWMLNVYE